MRPEPDAEVAFAVHVPVDQWQLQPQLARRVLAHLRLTEWKLVDAELPDLWVRHVPSACQLVMAHERLLEKLLQGVDGQDRELVREAAELQEPL